MSHHHFTAIERGKIEELNKLGLSSRKIAERLCCHRSSVSRELKRFVCSSEYRAQKAQQDYESKRRNSKPIGKWSKELETIVTEKLELTWSPEQIANTVTKGRLSFKTIYNWVYTGKLSRITAKNLRRKGKKKTSQTAKHFARGVPIRNRPKEVYGRKTFGHWELDTVVPKRYKKSTCFATFIKRKTRFYIALVIPDRTSASMEAAIKYLYQAF